MRRLAALLAVLALCLPLAAADRNVLLIDDDRADVFDLESLMGLCFPADFRPEAQTSEFYSAKRAADLENSLGAALDSAYKTEDWQKVQEARKALDEARANHGLASSPPPGAEGDAGQEAGGNPAGAQADSGGPKSAPAGDQADSGGRQGDTVSAQADSLEAQKTTGAQAKEARDGMTVLKTVAPEDGGEGSPSAVLRRAFAKNMAAEVADYVLANGADIAVFITSEDVHGLVRCRIFVFDGKRIEKVYERICPETERDFDEAEAVFCLMPFFYPPDASLVVLDRTAPKFGSLRPQGALVVARPGTYSYWDENKGGPGFLEVGPSRIVHFSYSHQNRAPSPLLATAFSSLVEIRANGKSMGHPPVLLQDLSAPFSLAGRMEGFRDLGFQSDKPVDGLHLRLLPATLARKELYEESRDRFYLSFARTLGLFGAKVLLSSLDAASGVRGVLGLGVEGFVWISVVDLISNLFDYYRAGISISEQGGL